MNPPKPANQSLDSPDAQAAIENLLNAQPPESELINEMNQQLIPCHRCGGKLSLQNTWTPSYWTYCDSCEAEVYLSSVEVSTEQHDFYQHHSVWPYKLYKAAMQHAVDESNKRIGRTEMEEQLALLVTRQLKLIQRLRQQANKNPA